LAVVIIAHCLCVKSHGDGSSGRKKHGESRAEQGGSTYVESVPYWTFKKLLRLWSVEGQTMMATDDWRASVSGYKGVGERAEQLKGLYYILAAGQDTASKTGGFDDQHGQEVE
jgi:hypothetical protein